MIKIVTWKIMIKNENCISLSRQSYIFRKIYAIYGLDIIYLNCNNSNARLSQ